MIKAKLKISPYHRNQDCTIGCNVSKDIVWWGFSQIHKWRWNETHIDLGCISVYNLKRKWFWKCVAFLIKPLRMFYHWRYVNEKF